MALAVLPPGPITPEWQAYIDSVVAANISDWAAANPCTPFTPDATDSTFSLRVASVFIIAVASAAGVGLPVFLGTSADVNGPLYAIVKAFAGGIVLAVGLVHSFADSVSDFAALSADPAFAATTVAGVTVSGFPIPSAVTVGSILAVFALEQLVASWFRRLIDDHDRDELAGHTRGSPCLLPVAESAESESSAAAAAASGGTLSLALVPATESWRDKHAAHGGHEEGDSVTVISIPGGGGAHMHVGHSVHPAGPHDENHHTLSHMHGFGALLAARQLQGRRLVVAYVLEIGIVVHSVIIGVNLGVKTTGLSGVTSLLIALCFHQFFEGLGLGAAIAQAQVTRLKSLVMMATFAATTPLGIAIGIGVASAYTNDAFTASVVKMVFNAIAAGILIHLALVDLLVEEFSKPELDAGPARARMQRETMLLSAAVGAGCMTTLAIWA